MAALDEARPYVCSYRISASRVGKHKPNHEMFREMAANQYTAFHAELLRASGQQQLVAVRCPPSMELESTTVHGIINGLVQSLPNFAGDHVVFHVDEGAAQLATVFDRLRLRQAPLTLCIDSSLTVNSDGVIRIDAHLSKQRTTHVEALPATGLLGGGQYVAIYISDVGCSIPVNLRKLLFESLQAMWNLEEGIVIERSNIYSIVKWHGGWIEFENEFDVRTTFTVNLPIAVTPRLLDLELRERPLDSIAHFTSRRY